MTTSCDSDLVSKTLSSSHLISLEFLKRSTWNYFFISIFNTVFIGISGRIKWKEFFYPLKMLLLFLQPHFVVCHKGIHAWIAMNTICIYIALSWNRGSTKLGILEFIRNKYSNFFSLFFDWNFLWDDFISRCKIIKSYTFSIWHFLSTKWDSRSSMLASCTKSWTILKTKRFHRRKSSMAALFPSKKWKPFVNQIAYLKQKWFVNCVICISSPSPISSRNLIWWNEYRYVFRLQRWNSSPFLSGQL